MTHLTENDILSAANDLADYAKEIYRELHRFPETAHHEFETHRRIRRELDRFGIPYEAPAGNITVAALDSGLSGATVGLRCDTDALPVQEETGLPFSSENPGVMHACGHDAHTAIGLASARLLKENMGQWTGRVKVIFQPAEEGEPGADEVIATGLVNDVDVFFGLHVWSPFESGTLHISPIPVSASVDMFTIQIDGVGGHGATPEKCHDALVAGAELVCALQTAVSRRISPMEPAVLTIGSFQAGGVGNIIAQRAILKGTIRALSEKTRETVCEAMEEIARNIAQAHGCQATVIDNAISGVLENDERAVALARDCAVKIIGDEHVQPQRTMMLGDDFANYKRIAPICYGQVGIANEAKGTHYAHHNGRFKMDEDMFPACIAWMSSFAVRAAEEWRKKNR